MSRVRVPRLAPFKGFLPVLALALVVVALFAASLLAIALCLWLLVNGLLQIYVDALNL